MAGWPETPRLIGTRIPRLDGLGKASGKPWAADQKQATLAAWIALAGVRR